MAMGPIKLAIRTDRGAGLVRAFFAPMDPRSDMEWIEVATISVVVLDRNKAVFERWKELLKVAIDDAYEAVIGVRPEAHHEFRPGDMN